MHAPVQIHSGHPCFSVSSSPGLHKGGSDSSPTHVRVPTPHVTVPPGQRAHGGPSLGLANQAFHTDAHGDCTWAHLTRQPRGTGCLPSAWLCELSGS